jgi:hypothetical protein
MSTPNCRRCLTSLLLVEEWLLEADFFVQQLRYAVRIQLV